MSVTVADLVARLGLKTDEGAFAAGDKWITRLQAGMAGLLGYLSYRWAKGQIEQTVELGSHLSDLSKKLGVPAEALQELGYASSQSGGSMEMLGTSMGKLAKLAFDAKKGSKEAASTFHAMGVKVTEADGALRPAEDILGDIADHMKSLPDGTEKTALAMRVFGRSGKDMIPLLDEGSEGIARLRQEFIDLGGEMTGDTADALESFGDETDKVGVVISGIRNQIVVGLLPYLKEAVSGFIEWYKANRLIIRARIERLMAAMIPILRVIVGLLKVAFTVLEATINLVGNWIEILTQLWGEYKVALAGALGAMLAFKAASIEAAIASAAAWAAPLAAIAAILLLGEDIWVWAQGGDSVIGDIHKGLVRMFVEAIEFWVKAVGDFFEGFWKFIDETARRFADVVPEEIRYFLGIDDDSLKKRSDERKARRYAEEHGTSIETGRLATFLGGEEQLNAYYKDRDAQQRAQAAQGVAYHLTIQPDVQIVVRGDTSPEHVADAVRQNMEYIIRQAYTAATVGRITGGIR